MQTCDISYLDLPFFTWIQFFPPLFLAALFFQYCCSKALNGCRARAKVASREVTPGQKLRTFSISVVHPKEINLLKIVIGNNYHEKSTKISYGLCFMKHRKKDSTHDIINNILVCSGIKQLQISVPSGNNITKSFLLSASTRVKEKRG